MKRIYITLLALSGIALSACEDVIDVSLDQGETLLVVESMITNENKAQKVKLSNTAAYFDNKKTPSVSGAVVVLKEYDASNALVTTDTLIETVPNTGEYFTTKITAGTIGNRYELTVNAMGETYVASSTMQRIPPIDSLVFRYETYSIPELTGWRAFYYGPEIPGIGDNYLFRIHRNGKEYNKPTEIYFASDELVDGNYIADVDLTPEVFELGDTIKIELFTMNKDQYYFFVELARQVNNGGIFASPPANVRTNIRNVDASRKKAVGYFSANAKNSITEIVK
jgi:Domain of unknown function (DUF4249)